MERKILREQRALTGDDSPVNIGGMFVLRRFSALLPVLALLVLSCRREKEAGPPPFDAAFVRLSAQEIATLPLAISFGAPLGGEFGALVYNAQPFRVTRHLGDDLNGIGGWNSDRGDPVFAAGSGRVIFSGVPGPGWGNMIILAHRVPEPDAARGWRIYQTVYAHLEKRLAQQGEIVRRGQKIGTVGTADGRYLAHLHFEVRRSGSVYPGAGYADAPLDRVSPDAFVSLHRAAADSILLPPP